MMFLFLSFRSRILMTCCGKYESTVFFALRIISLCTVKVFQKCLASPLRFNVIGSGISGYGTPRLCWKSHCSITCLLCLVSNRFGADWISVLWTSPVWWIWSLPIWSVCKAKVSGKLLRDNTWMEGSSTPARTWRRCFVRQLHFYRHVVTVE